MVEYFSLQEWHHFFLDPEYIKENYIDSIEDDILLNNVLFLTNNELRGILEVFENILEKNLMELVERYGRDEAVKKYSDQYYEPDLIGIYTRIRGITQEEILNEILKKSTSSTPSKTITVKVPHEYRKTFGGFSIAGDVKQHFPRDETIDLDIIIPDGTLYKAHRSQESRIKIKGGMECLDRLGVKENDQLEIEILEPFKRYRIIRVIHASWTH